MSPADGRSTRGGSTSVRGRVRSPHMAKLYTYRQPAYLYLTAAADAPMAGTDGRIVVSLNAPPPERGILTPAVTLNSNPITVNSNQGADVRVGANSRSLTLTACMCVCGPISRMTQDVSCAS